MSKKRHCPNLKAMGIYVDVYGSCLKVKAIIFFNVIMV
jgi:hypothetical protein